MEPTRLLPAFIEELWARKATAHATAWRSGLHLRAFNGDQLHVERGAEPHWVRVSYYVAQPDGEPEKDLEVVFVVIRSGEWIPSQFYRAKTGEHLYVEIDDETGEMTLLDPVNQWACAAYCDGWSFHLREQGWLTHGVVI